LRVARGECYCSRVVRVRRRIRRNVRRRFSPACVSIALPKNSFKTVDKNMDTRILLASSPNGATEATRCIAEREAREASRLGGSAASTVDAERALEVRLYSAIERLRLFIMKSRKIVGRRQAVGADAPWTPSKLPVQSSVAHAAALSVRPRPLNDRVRFHRAVVTQAVIAELFSARFDAPYKSSGDVQPKARTLHGHQARCQSRVALHTRRRYRCGHAHSTIGCVFTGRW
jgi:hypothetical protein